MIMRLERLAPLAGVAAGVLWLAGVLVLQIGNPAEPSAEDVLAHFRDHRTTILAGGVLAALGVFAFFWFLAALVARMAVGSAWLAAAAAIGGTAGGAMMLALTGPHTTGATTDVQLLGPESSVAFWRLGHTYFVGGEVALAVLVAAVALAAFETRFAPRWLAWASLVLALLLLVLPVAWLALIFLLPLWLAVLGVVLFRRAAAGPGRG